MLSVSDRIKLWSNKKTLISAAPSLDTANKSNGSKSSNDKGENDEGSNATKRSLVQLRRDGPLNQCINELSSRKCFSEVPQEVRDGQESVASPTKSRRNSQNDALPATPSHFVTVIEVKETKPIDSVSSAPVATAEEDCDDIAEETAVVTRESSGGDELSSRSSFLGDGRSVDAGEGTFLDKKFKPTLPPGLPQDVKKKVPPRPPPKFIRRAAPVDPPTVPGTASVVARKSADSDSPSSSLERNIKPSDIQRQKSSDSVDVKLAKVDGRKIKSENYEKTRLASESIRSSSSQSPTGSLNTQAAHVTTTASSGGSPTGSLEKVPENRTTDSPTGSLEKINARANDNQQNVGSKESLASQGAISERIKSYESISSLSSDSMKAGGPLLDNEPYYDTVPMDNGDGDYVYIQSGGGGTTDSGGKGAGSTSSRDDISTAGSTLPMPAYPRSQNSSQASVHVEPESPGKSSNYVNINYFLMQNHETRSSSIDSDEEGDQPPLMRAISHDDNPNTPGAFRKLQSGANRNTTVRQIISSIITSETFYVECLGKMMQYMKAIKATLTTSQPVISDEEFQTMFFKIEELHAVHTDFLAELRAKAAQQEDDICIGDTFKKMAGYINLYGAFLHNYGRAIDTVKKCGHNNTQFKEIVSRIVLNSKNEQSLPLEDLLHKPVARVQKNALVLEDLLNQTPPTHVDHPPLKQAQHVIRNLLSEFNVIQTKRLLSDDKTLRRFVKHSTIVELVDAHRKVRHLFLFNDVITCAKAIKAQRQTSFEFEVKWYILLKDICVLRESQCDHKEVNPVNILQLKSQACTVRDLIQMEKHDEKMRGKGNASKVSDKHKKKLADLEKQLFLASPNLVFRLSNRATNKTMVFFLSSDFERTQWIESILTLQESCNLPGVQPMVNIDEIQMSIAACQTILQSEAGSPYSMLRNNDDSLLFGDLHLTIQGLTGLNHASDLFICVEIDSYSHYFRKAKTKLICRSSSPLWNESFVMELEGSQNVRFLLYEDHEQQARLLAHHVLPLNRLWLQDVPTNKTLHLSESITLNTTIKFLPDEGSHRRVPTSKPGALFGSKMLQVVKREKRNTPFIISACIREVERRGMAEVGIYRVSGSASDLTKLKKSFETNPYEAEQLLKEVDIHSVTGILKSYLRELPEALFTDQYYPKLSETYNKYSNFNEAERSKELLTIFSELPPPNKDTINFILDHLIRVHQQEAENKMSLHNLAMVFGPTLLRPGPATGKQRDGLETSTVGVMAQAGILYSFLQARLK
ncbi:active breakpoint cluster region-related protein isoform X2 [Phlebotomus argentipes]|uniref:active breakpoint cluster region-related protein isoform X2 n=1 Tax=Phlebotomus argentipes TaxID=94469 RepID=UPI0028930523|nr:active breakpoint cluster region-related protein isoform X2 [Phlebotomus argentipes]